jgi:hypothetical protein
MKSLYDILAPEDRADSFTPSELDTAQLSDKASVKDFARDILNSAQYRLSVLRRIVLDDLPPAVEIMLYAYAYGKPVDRLEVTDKTARKELTPEAIAIRAKRLQEIANLLAEEEATPPSEEGSVH